MPGSKRKRKKTLAEVAYPSADLTVVARKWVAGSSQVMLNAIWEAYDLLIAEVLNLIDLELAPDDLERSVTQFLEPRIHRALSGDEPFYVQHGAHEWETRLPPPAQPPLYDIAFVLSANPRIMWPIEAKVLKTDQAVAAYVQDVNNEFLTCRYAPFSPEGVMLGYLLKGDPRLTFKRIEAKVPCELELAPLPANRHQARSEHRRKVPSGKKYAVAFRCHHLVLLLTSADTN